MDTVFIAKYIVIDTVFYSKIYSNRYSFYSKYIVIDIVFYSKIYSNEYSFYSKIYNERYSFL